MRIAFVALAGATIGLALAAPGAATKNAGQIDPEANSDDRIIVIGEKQRRKRISSFIETVVEPSRNDQYARFEKPICPTVRGLPASYNAVVENRMRQVAEAAGIGVRPAGCAANIAVLTVKDPRNMLQEMRENFPEIFGTMSIPDRDRLVARPGPAWVWHDIEVRDGMGAAEQPLTGGVALESGLIGHSSVGGSTSGRMYRSPNSRITKATSNQMNMSILLIDKRELLGVNLRQIGDYAVMRLLADTDDANIARLPERSIMALFHDRRIDQDPAFSVTAWDFALLKSLYEAKMNLSASKQRTAMSRTFEKELLRIAEEQSREE